MFLIYLTGEEDAKPNNDTVSHSQTQYTAEFTEHSHIYRLKPQTRQRLAGNHQVFTLQLLM